MKLNDLNSISREEFLELYTRYSMFNTPLIEGVDCDVIDENICINLASIKDSVYKVPDIVDGLIGNDFSNFFIRELDLNNVKIIYDNALSNFKLNKIKGDKLREIRSYGLSNNGLLLDLYFPVLELIGYRSFDRCVNLKNFHAPNLKKIDDYAFDESSLEFLKCPLLEYLGILGMGIWCLDGSNFKLNSEKLIIVDFGDIYRDNLKIDSQEFLFLDKSTNKVYNSNKKELLLM